MSRALTAAVAAALLLVLATPAHAAISMGKTADAVVVVGDDGPQSIQLLDGTPSTGPVFSFYAEPAQSIDLGDSGCTSDGGAGGGFENITCPAGSPTVVVFALNGGDDTFGWYGDAVFDALDGLAIDFGAGSDSNESGIKGIDTFIDGGADADDLSGHDGPSSEVEGGPGDDRIVGGGALSGEILRGGDGNDEILGLSGNDQIFGDAGGDTISGGADSDTITGGPGQDAIEGDGVPNAFSGNDTLHLADGERDSAVCGFGADTVTADAIDLLPLGDCESVSGQGGGGGGGPAGGGGAASSAKVALAKPGKLSARKRRLAVRVSCPASATGSCAGRVTFSVRFKERGKTRSVSLGAAAFNLAPGASRTVARKLSKQVVRRLRRARQRRLTVRATSRDTAGRTFTSRRTAALAVGR